jgi:DNA-binding transcriptional LysR family regulator
MRTAIMSGLYVWEFKEGDRELNVRVESQLIVNGFNQMTKAALAGLGLAFTLEDAVQPHIDEGRLVRVLEEWCPSFTGYHLYYPSRRQPSPSFSLCWMRCG